MRVVVNYLPALETRTGIGHYTAELVRGLREQAGEDAIDTFPGSRGRRLHDAWIGIRRKQLASPTGPKGGMQLSPRSSLRRRMFEGLRSCGRAAKEIVFNRLCHWKKYDLYHEPNYIPLPCDCPTVITVHDLSTLLHPEWHPSERVAQFEKHFRRSVTRCVHFFTVSDFVRGEMIRTLGIPAHQVTRTYNGIRPGLMPLPPAEVADTLRRLDLPPRYLLHVGTIEPRKNILTLLHAYCALPESLRAHWPLLLVGGWGWHAADVADFLESGARQRGVFYRSYVPEGDLAALYNGARALVFPSLYEGFGLPPVEMLACGGAVLASTAGAVAETVGRNAHLVDPLDTEGWREAMRRVMEEDDWWRSLRQGAVEAARPFTWERCARDTLRVYRRLCGGSNKQPLAA